MVTAREIRPLTPDEFAATRKFIATPHGRIAYVERGSGPAALFVHGAFLNGYQWRHQVAALSDLRRVIALDSLGMGHTELAPGQPFGFASQAAMLAAFLDALAIAEVDIVGNDSGAGAVQVFAARHPQRIRTMALTNCDVHDYDDTTCPATVRLRASLADGRFGKALAAALDNPAIGRKLLAIGFEHPDAVSDETIQTYLRPLAGSPHRIAQVGDYLAAIHHRDLVAVEHQLKALRAPTLVMWGTGDVFFPVKWAHWLGANLPSAEVVELPGAHVYWPEERPELLNHKLRELWTRARIATTTGHTV